MTPSDLDALERLAQATMPRAWLLTGSRMYRDKVYVNGDDAAMCAAGRRDETKLVPLYAACDPTTILALVALARKGMEAK
jgi:hypothetical protein